MSMLKLSQYAISKSNGFCVDFEPTYYLKDLEPHSKLLNSFSEFTPSAVATLPQLSNISALSNNELEYAFLVHTVLNSHWYWHSDKPQVSIPANLAIPSIQLSKILRRPPIIGLVSTDYHNWQLIDKAKPFHPDNLKCIISFSGTRDESNFYNYENYIEHLGAPAVLSIIEITDHYNNTKEFKKSLEIIRDSVCNMKQALAEMSNKMDVDVFYFGFRRKLRSFSAGAVFEGTGENFSFLHGASAIQTPLIKLLDSFLGIFHKSEFLRISEQYMKFEHREFLSEIRKRSVEELRRVVRKHNFIDLWNEIIMELYGFREQHSKLTYKFITIPSNTAEGVGTGGTALKEFLKDLSDSTISNLITP